MNRLLHALRTAAREEDAAIAACPTDVIPMLAETSPASIANQLLSTVREGRQQPADDLSVARRRAHPGPPVKLGAVRRAAWTVGATALAAAAAFVIWTRASVEPRLDDASQGLPDYTMAVSGGVADTRGGVTGDGTDSRPPAQTWPVRVRSGSELKISVRPETAVVGPVTARAFVVHEGTVAEVKPAVRIAGTGAVELRLPGAAVVAPAAGGRVPHDELRVVVGRPETVAAVTAADVNKPHDPQSPAAQRWFVLALDPTGGER